VARRKKGRTQWREGRRGKGALAARHTGVVTLHPGDNADKRACRRGRGSDERGARKESERVRARGGGGSGLWESDAEKKERREGENATRK
jgi:hypothetical protein